MAAITHQATSAQALVRPGIVGRYSTPRASPTAVTALWHVELQLDLRTFDACCPLQSPLGQATSLQALDRLGFPSQVAVTALPNVELLLDLRRSMPAPSAIILGTDTW